MTDRHAHQHYLIIERRELWHATPKNKNKRPIRREAFKKYYWTLADHLRLFHSSAVVEQFESAESLEQYHEGLHEDD